MKKVLAITILGISLSAHAEFFDGNRLLQLFKSSQLVDNEIAYGYAAGVADQTSGVLHCAPGNVTIQQLGDMVVDTLLKNPSERHKTGDMFVRATLMNKWPCKTPTAVQPEPQKQQSGKSV